MKYVKCLYTSVNTTRLTFNKIYKVYDHFITSENEFVEITDNTGDRAIYSIDKNWFEDATSEVISNNRDKKLDNLGL